MQLKEIGEFGFIERFSPCFEHLIKNDFTGIGDDCAILSVSENEDWIVSTDILIEEVHFLRDAITPFQLGYKSLAVNLSDIAAMGGKPVASFLSLAIPADLKVEYLDAFMQGYHELSAKYDCALLGGDTTRSLKHLTINVVVIGKCAKGKARRRSDALPADVICVTGNLGDSAAGLQVLLQKLKQDVDEEMLVIKHHLPEPQINEGLFLSSYQGVHAMMDISDGIASDLKHILKASKRGAVIEVEKIPVSGCLMRLSEKYSWNPLHLATSGGEDYQLLLTVDPVDFRKIKEDFEAHFNKQLFNIGHITNEHELVIQWRNKGVEVEMDSLGFNHFE